MAKITVLQGISEEDIRALNSYDEPISIKVANPYQSKHVFVKIIVPSEGEFSTRDIRIQMAKSDALSMAKLITATLDGD